MLPHATAIMSCVAHVPHVAALRRYHCTYTSPSPVYKYGGESSQQLVTSKKQLSMEEINASKLRYQFLHLLRTRRSVEVQLPVKVGHPVLDPVYQETPHPKFREPMESCPEKDIPNPKERGELVLEDRVQISVEVGHPVLDPVYQETPHPKFSEAMESCPKKDIPNPKDLKEENLYLRTESGEQGRLPVLILSMRENSHQRRPAVVFLHSTKKCKEWLRPLLKAYASRGYVAVAIDSRYHGERASSMTTYRDALVSSWGKGDTMPFIFDTVWDLIKLADYLTQREDIDPSKIGITGESLGGMHAWFAAAVDVRYAVAVPIIGVQGFRWAIDQDKWQGRVDSIKDVFEEARADLGKSNIDKEVVEKVWDRIAPDLASQFDSPYTIPIIAPRPLLILNGEKDPRCPLEGLEIPKSRAHKAYEEAGCPDKFKLIAQPGIGHEMTTLMVKEASDWFDRFLKSEMSHPV